MYFFKNNLKIDSLKSLYLTLSVLSLFQWKIREKYIYPIIPRIERVLRLKNLQKTGSVEIL